MSQTSPRPSTSATQAESAIHSRATALVLLALLSVVWGTHWPIVKMGLHTMPPLHYAVLRLAGGLITIVLILLGQRRLRLPPRADVPIIASVGLLQISASIVIMNLALQVVPAGRSSVLVYAQPLWVAVLMWTVFRQKARWNEVLGLALGIGGILALVNPGVINWGVPAEVVGTLAMVGYGVIWAGVTIHIRRHTWVAAPLELQPWMLLLAMVPVTVMALVMNPGRGIDWQPVTVLVLLYSGPLATAFAYWASQAITRSLGPLAAAMGFLGAPVIGLLAGSIMLGEKLDLIDIASFGMVLAGVALTTLIRPKAGSIAATDDTDPGMAGAVEEPAPAR